MPSRLAEPPVSTIPEASRPSTPGPRGLLRDQAEDLLDARLDDLGEDLAREHARSASADARHLDHVVVAHRARERGAEALLELLGFLRRRAQPGRDVVGQVAAAEAEHRGVAHRAAVVDDEVGRAAADVDHRDAEIALLVGEHRVRRRERREHDLRDLEAAALAALDDVLHGGRRGGQHVHARLEAHARHALRLLDAVLVVDDVLLRQDVQDLTVHRQGDRPGGVEHQLDVGRR